MAQQTAVEWIEHNIQSDMNFMEIMGLIRQAKAMEKEQILNASRQFADYPFDENDIQQYYNETYNK
jgi:predicted patatin/cPLA2 family phospholipase